MFHQKVVHLIFQQTYLLVLKAKEEILVQLQSLRQQFLLLQRKCYFLQDYLQNIYW